MPRDLSAVPRLSVFGMPWIPQGINGSVVFEREHEYAWRSPWLVPFEVMEDVMGPMFISDFIVPGRLTDEQCDRLSSELGRPIVDPGRGLLDDAIHQLVATIALHDRLPSWQALAKRLRRMVKLGEELVRLCKTGPSSQKGTEVLSVDEAVMTFLTTTVIRHDQQRDGLHEVLNGIGHLMSSCKWALDSVERQTTKRGPPTQFELRCFLEGLVIIAYVAQAKPRLPSKSDIDRGTPFFSFVRAAIGLAAKIGVPAIEGSSLQAHEKRAGIKKLKAYSDKGDSALLDQLIKVRIEALQRKRTII
jgi:hypothetical protein